MSSLLEEVTGVIRELFEDDRIAVTESTSAPDVEGWDSLMHLNIIIAVEQRYRIRFSTAEIARLKEPGQNVGSLLAAIRAKTGASA